MATKNVKYVDFLSDKVLQDEIQKHYLEIEDVLNRYRVARQTLYNFNNNNLIRSYKIGGILFFHKTDLSKFFRLI